MALFSRIQISNYLDGSKGPKWNADFVGSTFDVGGQSAAVVMNNGTGKTCVTDAILWMLSQGQALSKRVATAMAPVSSGVYSHIRVEFVVPHSKSADMFVAMGSRVDGEHHVFGVYANREGTDKIERGGLYYYTGVLEDVPVHMEHVTDDGETLKTIVPDEDFRASLKPAMLVRSKQDWVRAVNFFMPTDQLRLMVDYQKRGGGDKAASLYNVEKKTNEEFDKAFFRLQVAPEILGGIIDDDSRGGEEGVSFETGIVTQANLVVKAKISTAKKAGRIQAMERANESATVVAAAADRFIASKAAHADAASKHEQAVMDASALLDPGLFPGMPRKHSALAGIPAAEAAVLRSIGFRDGEIEIDSALLTSRGIVLESIGGRSRETTTLLPAVYPAAEDARWFPLSSIEGPKADARKASVVVDVRSVVSRHLNHPLLVGEWRIRSRLAAAEAETSETREVLNTLQGQQLELAEACSAFTRSEGSFVMMQDSGLFTELELADPMATLEKVGVEAREAGVAHEGHRHRTSDFRARKPQYDRVVEHFGPVDLAGCLVRLEAAAAEATGEKSRTASVLAGAEESFKANRAEEGEVSRSIGVALPKLEHLRAAAVDLDALEGQFGAGCAPGTVIEELDRADRAATAAVAHHRAEWQGVADALRKTEALAIGRAADLKSNVRRRDDLKGVEPARCEFTSKFPGRVPSTFDTATRNEIDKARLAERQATQAITALAPGLGDLTWFETEHATVTPQEWLFETASRRESLVEKRRLLKLTLEGAERDLANLKSGAFAPTGTDNEAATTLKRLDIPFRHLHELLAAGPMAGEKRRALLSQFSAILFAPVFKSADDAATAASCLAKVRLPVPVLIEADVLELVAGRGTPASVSGLLHHGVLAGIETRNVQLILDPSLMERDLAAAQSKVDETGTAIRTLDPEIAAASNESPLARRVRSAQSAIEADSRQKSRDLEASARAAAKNLAELAAVLTPENIRLAGQATRFDGLGGEGELLRLDRAILGLEAEIRAATSRLETLGEEAAQVEARVAEADAAVLKARSMRHWKTGARKAAEFLATGGRPAISTLEATIREAEGKLAQLREACAAADREIGVLKQAEAAAAEREMACRTTLATWSDPLARATAFVADGGPAFLDAAGAVESELLAAVARAGARRVFDFEGAARHVSARGTTVDETRRKLEEVRLSVAKTRDRLTVVEAETPGIRNTLHVAAVARADAEESLRAILRSFSGLSGLGFPRQEATEASPGLLAISRRLLAGLSAMNPAVDNPPIYSDLEEAVKGFRLGSIRADLIARKGAVDQAKSAYEDTFEREMKRGAMEGGLLEVMQSSFSEPSGMKEHIARHAAATDRERATWRQAQELEEQNRTRLVDILLSLSASAQVYLQTMKKTMRPENNAAGFEIEGSMASQEDIADLMTELVDKVGKRVERFETDSKGQASEKETEDHFSELAASVRNEIYTRLFPNARVKVIHPQMRGGKPFYLVKEGISGGQATALMLLWTIKLAAYSVDRASSRSGVSKQRARDGSHSIIIIDGLFSDLSDPQLIRESMDAMRYIKGKFQLIGFIHSPFYRNDFELFPTCIVGRKVVWKDETGAEGPMVSIQTVDPAAGKRVGLLAQRGRNLLGPQAGGKPSDALAA